MAAFGNGDFAFAAEILSSHPTAESLPLYLRALGRSGGLAQVAEVLRDHDYASLGHFEAGELLVLRYETLSALGRHVEAFDGLAEARARVFSSGSPILETELHYASAVSALSRGDQEGTKAAIRLALAVDQSGPKWLKTDRQALFSARYWRARVCELRALIDRSERNIAGEAAWLTSAFAEFDRSGVIDRSIEAIMLSNLADLIGEADLPPLTDFVKARIAKIEWTRFTNRQEYHTFSSLGRNSAIIGDHIGALRCFRKAADVAPSVPLKVRAILDRSFLMTEIGERTAADEELEYAMRACDGIDWNQCIQSERIALAMLAEQVASRNSTEAKRLLDKYSSLKSVSGATLLSFGGDTDRAHELRARAAIYRTEGLLDRATLAYLDELQIWHEHGFEYRAAVASSNLAELTGEPHYLARVREFSKARPQSWLARRLSAFAGDHLTAVVSA